MSSADEARRTLKFFKNTVFNKTFPSKRRIPAP
jgi:hypothetical protein